MSDLLTERIMRLEAEVMRLRNEAEGASEKLQSMTIGLRDPPWTPDSTIPEGFEVEGDEAMYKVIALREYDENGDIVDIGDESDPLDAGHTLKPTWHMLVPCGTADNQILRWNNTSKAWEVVDPPTVQSVLTWNSTDGVKWEAVEEFACPE